MAKSVGKKFKIKILYKSAKFLLFFCKGDRDNGAKKKNFKNVSLIVAESAL